ncbi:MAG: undecaprenyl/decaprenyl-phosphate alpha-N-acetylglucosaminyl 1-phosphate transferase [Saprospiraceae bacterium]|nr:undecaprenyl/decaprenyl-phosphate alpha-N-acetylglucosaminyl 1-phosphate transferase [Saprospiraceae bacterium]MBK8668209.1 undecaprenyl/decaprenyl-phosphate alpha-N-acetylglucosaminyl 1-phosphate transferase [Saprospiraceae bacterium]MBL0099319.1 undecaprenyl/decaprenyl-phosphate alpha-N-acetylglucosaminyl 1-phosphate transferase [Saprospiraceae bacterium]
MYDIILAFITSFALTYLAIPSIIHLSHKKNLMDEPGERRSHKVSTPSLGGIGIFAGTLFSIIMWTPFNYFGELQYILCAFIIIFLIGAKDDIDPISPSKKFLGELFAAGILVFRANVRLTSLYGFFGIYEIPELISIVISIFTIIVIINAFNLIDGINGLSASLGLLITFVLGTWFYLIGSIEISIVAFALGGALVAFLKYNITPAQIFMGDTGALLLGLVCSILAIKFIELQREVLNTPYTFKSAPSVAIAILILPLFDTLRVFVLRIMEGKSPFNPDRKHIHHIMIDLGLSHMQATGVLFLTNVLFIILAITLQDVGNLLLLSIIISLALIMSFFASWLVVKRKARTPSS